MQPKLIFRNPHGYQWILPHRPCQSCPSQSYASATLTCSIDIARQSTARLVYHVVHPIRVSWKTVLAGLKEAGIAFDLTSKKEWLNKVRSSISAREEDPSSGMLPLWVGAVSLISCPSYIADLQYGSDSETKAEPPVACENARSASSTLANIKPLETEDIARMVKCWRTSGFM
jgi:hypothetical protein